MLKIDDTIVCPRCKVVGVISCVCCSCREECDVSDLSRHIQDSISDTQSHELVRQLKRISELETELAKWDLIKDKHAAFVGLDIKYKQLKEMYDELLVRYGSAGCCP